MRCPHGRCTVGACALSESAGAASFGNEEQATRMCTPSIVNEALKGKIAAHAASFPKATRSPFGAKDEIGMLNLIDTKSL